MIFGILFLVCFIMIGLFLGFWTNKQRIQDLEEGVKE